MPQSCDLAVTKPGLNSDQQKISVPPPNPSFRVGSRQESSRLFLRQKLHGPSLAALCRKGQHALALQSQGRFADRNILKECMYRGETVDSCTRLIAAIRFKMMEKLLQQTDVEILYSYFRRPSFSTLRGESKQQPEGVPVGCDRMRGLHRVA